jgi:hypothetical protein
MKTAIPPRAADTSADADRVQTRLLREASVARRLDLGFSLSATVIGAARAALARSHPGHTRSGIDLRFVEIHYGPALAAALRDDLARRMREHPPAV